MGVGTALAIGAGVAAVSQIGSAIGAGSQRRRARRAGEAASDRIWNEGG